MNKHYKRIQEKIHFTQFIDFACVCLWTFTKKIVPHPTSFIYGHKVHGQSFIESNYYAIIKRFSYFNSKYTLQRTIGREREKSTEEKELIQMHFSDQIFLQKIKNGYVDVSGGGI